MDNGQWITDNDCGICLHTTHLHTYTLHTNSVFRRIALHTITQLHKYTITHYTRPFQRITNSEVCGADSAKPIVNSSYSLTVLQSDTNSFQRRDVTLLHYLIPAKPIALTVLYSLILCFHFSLSCVCGSIIAFVRKVSLSSRP